MFTLVLIRHGQSVWNLENRFTGWEDVDLSEKGIKEARRAGKLLKSKGFTFDVAYTSVLKRAIRTLWIILDDMDLMWIPTHCSWQLNERHYGGLQGLDKGEMAKKYGSEQIHIWRRGYDVSPPPIGEADSRYPQNDLRYSHLQEEDLPKGESLKDTLQRVLPYWQSSIVPGIKGGKKTIISAHGNSLRALVKHLDHISDEDITELNIPTGIPLVYELDEGFQVIQSYYLEGEITPIENADL